MPNSKELFRELVNKIQLDESREEIESLAYLILEHQFGLTKSDTLGQKELTLPDSAFLDEIVARVNLQEPIQYILGKGEFYGRQFKVDPSVLIPRPETELIIELALRAFPLPTEREMAIVDIGTGSGCLAITLSKELPNARVYATDVSAAALMTAVENAKQNQAAVEFIRHNILSVDLPLSGIQLMVSNPPYVTQTEKNTMKLNVTDHEPPEALFVPDDDPLRFYSAIARTGKKILGPAGKVIVEINERFGKEVSALFSKEGYHSILVTKDFAGKDRVVMATSSDSTQA
jgi:release factor glutamine methyltransferase